MGVIPIFILASMAVVIEAAYYGVVPGQPFIQTAGYGTMPQGPQTSVAVVSTQAPQQAMGPLVAPMGSPIILSAGPQVMSTGLVAQAPVVQSPFVEPIPSPLVDVHEHMHLFTHGKNAQDFADELEGRKRRIPEVTESRKKGPPALDWDKYEVATLRAENVHMKHELASMQQRFMQWEERHEAQERKVHQAEDVHATELRHQQMMEFEKLLNEAATLAIADLSSADAFSRSPPSEVGVFVAPAQEKIKSLTETTIKEALEPRGPKGQVDTTAFPRIAVAYMKALGRIQQQAWALVREERSSVDQRVQAAKDAEHERMELEKANAATVLAQQKARAAELEAQRVRDEDARAKEIAAHKLDVEARLLQEANTKKAQAEAQATAARLAQEKALREAEAAKTSALEERAKLEAARRELEAEKQRLASLPPVVKESPVIKSGAPGPLTRPVATEEQIVVPDHGALAPERIIVPDASDLAPERSESSRYSRSRSRSSGSRSASSVTSSARVKAGGATPKRESGESGDDDSTVASEGSKSPSLLARMRTGLSSVSIFGGGKKKDPKAAGGDANADQQGDEDEDAEKAAQTGKDAAGKPKSPPAKKGMFSGFMSRLSSDSKDEKGKGAKPGKGNGGNEDESGQDGEDEGGEEDDGQGGEDDGEGEEDEEEEEDESGKPVVAGKGANGKPAGAKKGNGPNPRTPKSAIL